MADMIEAKDAKKILGCDDATLNGFVNSGNIKAQRIGGKLMLVKSDVDKMKRDKDDDGTIVLTGDSDDLSIDLGKVVDDSAETIVQSKSGTDTVSGTESITFGDELEVVSFDDHGTGELVFDETKQTGNVPNLSFTDSNTAVMTAVDETSVGATTAPIEFQTDVEEGRGSSNDRPGTGRRSSVRSQRIRTEVETVHWIWPTVLVLTMLFGIFMIVPYYVIALWPHPQALRTGETGRGLDDNAWTNMAGGLSGFTVEPRKSKWEAAHAGEGGEYFDIKDRDSQAEWRIDKYRGAYKEAEERQNTFLITTIDLEKKTAKAKSGTDTYQVEEITRPLPEGSTGAPTKEYEIRIFPGSK